MIQGVKIKSLTLLYSLLAIIQMSLIYITLLFSIKLLKVSRFSDEKFNYSLSEAT